MTDIDGTLLDSKGEISDYTKEMIDLIKDDVEVILASARGYYSLKPYLTRLGLDTKDQYVIAFNGARVANGKDEAIFDAPLDKDIVLKALEYLEDKEVRTYLYDDSGRYDIKKIEDIKSRITIIAGVDTLEYLCKGGRVSKTVATIGGLANIKPVITVSKEGKVDVIAKKRGTAKTIEYIKEKIAEYEIDEDYDIYTVYTKGEENTLKLEEKLEDIKIDDRIQIGPTIGAHVGLGAYGIVFIEKR